MELILLFIVICLLALLLLWVTWQVQLLRQQLSSYNSYVSEVHEETLERVFTDDFLNSLRNHAELQLNNAVDKTHNELEHALQSSYQRLLQGVEQQAAQVFNQEMESYRQTISDAKSAASNIAKESEQQLTEIRQTIEKQSQAAIREEKQKLLKQLDDKLGDVVTHYLAESLGENVDLGSQKEYILQQLESHKEDIKKDMNDEF